MRGAEEMAPALSRVQKLRRFLQLFVDGVAGFTVGIPLAVPAAYAAGAGIGLAGLLGPQYFAWKKFTTPSANAAPGTPGFIAWQAHLTRAMQYKNTHITAHAAVYSGLAMDIARITLARCYCSRTSASTRFTCRRCPPRLILRYGTKLK
jgi:hypothetical protein